MLKKNLPAIRTYTQSYLVFNQGGFQTLKFYQKTEQNKIASRMEY